MNNVAYAFGNLLGYVMVFGICYVLYKTVFLDIVDMFAKRREKELERRVNEIFEDDENIKSKGES